MLYGIVLYVLYNTRGYSVFYTDSFALCNVCRYPLRIYVLIQIVIDNYEKVEDMWIGSE